jgi:hypothetical protein
VSSLLPGNYYFSGEIKMKNVRRLALGLLLGLTTAMAGVAFAQDPTPVKKESCCAKESCCCKGDSCKMKSSSMNHAAANKDESCCGDSCSMKKDGTTKSEKHECCGDSCSMKKEGAPNASATSDKHECCCGGDSCNMNDKKTEDMKGMKHKS